MSTFLGIFCPSNDPHCNVSFQEMSTALKSSSVIAKNHLSKAYFAHEAWQSEEYGFPLWSTCGNFLITGHFRIDYKDELAKRLGIEKKDVDLYNDGQLALLSYQKWGEKCVEYLEGDWAFALYDKERNSIFFARDPFLGNSALYYTRFKNRIYFSSDLNVFKGINHLTLKIDHTELLKFSNIYLTNTKGKTLFEGIKYIEPAKTISFNHELKPREDIFWRLEDIPDVRYKTDVQYVEHFRELFDNAVRTRLPKTTKTGILLSSGYDSTIIASYAASYLEKEHKKLYSFTSIPAYADQNSTISSKGNEQPLVESFAKGIPSLETSFEDFKSSSVTDLLLSDITADLNAPLIMPNTLWINGFFEKAKAKGIGRMLNGQQGNIFISWHGAHLHSHMLAKGQFKLLFNEINAISKVQKKSRYEIIKTHLYGDFRTDFNTLKARLKPIHEHHLFCYGLLNEEILDGVNWKQIIQDTPFIPTYSTRRSSKNIRRLLSENAILNASGPWHAIAQRHKIVITDPTCDIRLATFSLGIPENLWYKNGIKRYLYREAFKDRIPETILNNPLRMVQSADFSIRLNNDKKLDKLIKEILSDEKINGLINTKAIEACLLKFEKERNLTDKNHLGRTLLNQISFCLSIKKTLNYAQLKHKSYDKY